MKGADLNLVSATKANTEAVKNAPTTDADGTPTRFLAALRNELSTVEAQLWLGDAALVQEGDSWALLLPTRFKADWVRGHFLQALETARVVAGLTRLPDVMVQSTVRLEP